MDYHLTENCKRCLAHLVLASIDAVFAKEKDARPSIDENLTPDEEATLTRIQGAFVTLKCRGFLRGCIGTIVGHEPLYQNVWRMAQSAAFADPRFPPLTLPEWKMCEVEISVLSPALPCPDPEAIEIGKHGLILQYRGRTGVFLPQVPVEQGWDRLTYLEELCRKAGVAGGSWKAPEARLLWYEAIVFPVVR